MRYLSFLSVALMFYVLTGCQDYDSQEKELPNDEVQATRYNPVELNEYSFKAYYGTWHILGSYTPGQNMAFGMWNNPSIDIRSDSVFFYQTYDVCIEGKQQTTVTEKYNEYKITWRGAEKNLLYFDEEAVTIKGSGEYVKIEFGENGYIIKHI